MARLGAESEQLKVELEEVANGAATSRLAELLREEQADAKQLREEKRVRDEHMDALEQDVAEQRHLYRP